MPSHNPYGTVSGKTPMKARRTSVNVTAHIPVPQDETLEGEIEEFRPPEWRAPLNNRADLGYPDFYPSRPGFNQTEDVLTEEFVKNGFSAKTFVAVGAESFSMHGPIYGHLMNGCLGLLNRLGQDIAQKRDDFMPQVGDRQFKIPVRVTYNDTKRFQFLADLANPAVPLSRLMRNPVPHGFKGVELFESMFSLPLPSRPAHNRAISGGVGNAPLGAMSTPTPPPPPPPIPIDRALWFIRVLGANEISAHRGRAQPIATPVAAPSPIPATPSSTNTAPIAAVVQMSSNDWYTQEFTNMFCSWLRIQLNQLTLPVKPAAKGGVPVPKAPSGVLGDEKARARWLSKWDYSSKLLREMRARYLISTRILVAWLVDMLGIANLAQIGFITQLIGEHLPEISKHSSVARPCIRIVCAKLNEIRSSPAVASLAKVDAMLVHVVSSLFDSDPLVLMSPLTWRQHESSLEGILMASAGNERADTRADGTLRQKRSRRRLLDGVKARSDRLGFQPAVAESATSPRRQQMQDLQKLDGMDADTDMVELCRAYFDGGASPNSSNVDIARLEDKTFVLLNWAMGMYQLGVHRAYAVHTLLTVWGDLHEKYQAKQSKVSHIDFFSILYKWLDTCEAPRKGENAFAIGTTFGDLTRQGLFSYRRYLQVLIANGHSARSRSPGEPPSHHLPLLAAMPIFVQAKDLLLQRRLALCGDDEEAGVRLERDEERQLDDFKEEVMEYIPEIFGLDRYGRSDSLREVVSHEMPCATALSRYLFLQARFWLGPAGSDSLNPKNGRRAMDASTFVRMLHVYHKLSGYSTTADLLIDALAWSQDEEILDIVIDTIRRAADVWTANDKWQLLTNALMDRNHAQDIQGRHHSGLSDLLLELAKRGRLPEDDEEEVRASVRKHPKEQVKATTAWVDIKESMGPLHHAIAKGDVATAKSLSAKLYTRHGPFASWSGTWWCTVVKAIQNSDAHKAISVVDAAIAHIEQVDGNTDSKLGSVVVAWLEKNTPTEVLDLLSVKSSPVLCEILLNLVAHRRLHIVPTLLEKLAYGTWKQAAMAALATKGRLSSRNLRAVESSMVLTQHLLLNAPPNPALPPINLRQALVIQTERGSALSKANVPTLIRHLPFLIVLAKSRFTPEQLKREISVLFQGLATTPPFKAAAFRNLHILKDAFLSNEWSKPGIDAAVEEGMVDALKLIMSQGSSSSSTNLHELAALDSSSRSSAWMWTSIVLGMRVEFKRLALRIENGEDAAEARHTLNQLVHATLDREASADDTDLLCEAFRGIESIAASEIVAVGLERLTALLSQMLNAESQLVLESAGKSVDLVLRVLDSANMASVPTTPGGTSETSVLAARHGLLDIISLALQAVERQLTMPTEDLSPIAHLEGIIPPKAEDLFGVILKLLKFTLGIPIIETPSLVAPRPDFGRLASSFLRVIAIIARTNRPENVETLVDVLIYIIDSAPSQSRLAVHTALMAEMSSPILLSASADQPVIAAALPYMSPPRRPVALTNPTTMGDTEVLTLDDRPWEMFEYLNGPPRKVPPGQMFLASKPIKDLGSVPLSLFGPQMKRDAIPYSDKERRSGFAEEGEVAEEEPNWEDYASERNLGDGIAGEPVGVRQIATSLFSSGAETSSTEEEAAKMPPSPMKPAVSANTSNTSEPANGAGTGTRSRRASTRLTGGTQPVVPRGSNRDPIPLGDDAEDEDEDNSENSDSESDSSIEILDMPAGKRPRVGQKGVAGKTAARRTTGGKGVPKKNVRTVSGKMPRKGRF